MKFFGLKISRKHLKTFIFKEFKISNVSDKTPTLILPTISLFKKLLKEHSHFALFLSRSIPFISHPRSHKVTFG